MPFSSKEAEGSIPMEPVSMEASSDRMSPKMLPVAITSNCLGARTNCMAALSTYIWESSTSGYSLPISSKISRHSSVVSKTLALPNGADFFATLLSGIGRQRGQYGGFRFRCISWCCSLRVRRFPERGCARFAEVDVAGEFAHDEDVEAATISGLSVEALASSG